MFNTPVLLLIFNRLDTTQQVLEKIRQIQPKQLFIAADGPRPNVELDNIKTNDVRAYVLSNIDWPCEVHTLFREENLGCGIAVSQAISWFFEYVEAGIILEDDCLPDISFFRFCQELLEKYKYQNEIFHISGNNFQLESTQQMPSYYFSKYTNSWGWATWRRAWEFFDFKLEKYEHSKFLSNLKFYKGEKVFYSQHIEEIRRGAFHHIWDFQWMLSVQLNKGLAIIPAKNLVKNIGYGFDATHAFDPTDRFLFRNVEVLDFPLIHNNDFTIDELKDAYYYSNTFDKWRQKNLLMRLYYQVEYYFSKCRKLFSRR